MTQNRSIQTPLLRCIVNFFGNLGLQLHPHSLTGGSWYSQANVALNLAINCLVSYGLSRRDLLDFDTYRQRFEHRKPLFGAFLKLCINVFLPGSFLLSRVYCFLNGSRMVQLLDSPTIGKVYRCWPHTDKVFYGALVACHLNYLIFNWRSLKNIFRESDEAVLDLVSYLSQYAITFAHYLPVVIVHYFQYALLTVLGAVEVRLRTDELCNEMTVISEVQQLALISDQMNGFLSLSILVFIFVRIMNGISVFCLVFLNEQNNDTLDYVVPALCTWLYVLYLVRLNRRSRCTFARICSLLDDRLAPKTAFMNFSGPTKESVKIRLHGLQLYEAHFQMRLFSLAKIDSPFIMAAVLFILNYVVFLYQTN